MINGWKTQNYIKFVAGIVDDLRLDWDVTSTGSLIFDPDDSLNENIK
jgi:hypothetical protein